MKLYRGFNFKIKSGVNKNIFKDNPREPKNTVEFVHNVANQWFYNKFKVKARSETIFSSTCVHQAFTYTSCSGSLVEIEPLGEYKIIFSENVYDFNEYEGVVDITSQDAILCWLENQNYRCVLNRNEIPNDFKGEVMLDCEEFNVRILNKH